MVPETQWPGTEASTLELSTDSEVIFRKVLGSAEVLATRPGVDPLEVTRPLADDSWTSQSPQATSPSVITRQPTYISPGPWPPVASHVFGPSTMQVDDPDSPDRGSRQTTNWHHTQEDDSGSSHWQDPSSFTLVPHRVPQKFTLFTFFALLHRPRNYVSWHYQLCDVCL